MSSDPKPILVAAPPPLGSQIAKALEGPYSLVFASTCEEAKQLLLNGHKSGFAMILASISFDESRLFDLLNFVREMDEFDSLPFVVVQLARNKSLDMTSVKAALEELGVAGFVQVQNMSEQQVAKTLLETVLVSFAKPVKYERSR